MVNPRLVHSKYHQDEPVRLERLAASPQLAVAVRYHTHLAAVAEKSLVVVAVAARQLPAAPLLGRE